MTTPISRRRAIKLAGGLAAGTLLSRSGVANAGPLAPVAKAAKKVPVPGIVPDPTRKMGHPDHSMPFDHIIVVMMENHSFDNYFGMLPVRGQPLVDGFKFDAHGKPINSNMGAHGPVRAFHSSTECQPYHVSQGWNETHKGVNGGAMDGFVSSTSDGAMAYWDQPDLPFYYSLANTFTVANRWFCSAPCMTYPNRRFLLAGTAFGLVETTTDSLFDPPPVTGTIVDRLYAAGLSFRNYFADIPSSGMIPSIIAKHPGVLASIDEFYADCATGLLPAVSLIDPDYKLLDEAFGQGEHYLPGVKEVEHALGPALAKRLQSVRTTGASEEGPTNIQYGENFVASVVNAVIHSPAWPRTLLVWTYDEHGGYYDHVAPPAAPKPDNIAPVLKPGDVRGAYDILGPRVPTVVVSPYAKAHGVSNVVCDHTSILATIEHKWNLPPLTHRDARANTMMDFLDLKHPPALLKPPKLAPASDAILGSTTCDGAILTKKQVDELAPVTRLGSHTLGRLGF